MAGPTQFAADNTRPELANGVRAYVQFSAAQTRRFVWNGTSEKALFNNVTSGSIVCACEFGASNGTDQALIYFSTGTSSSSTRFSVFSRNFVAGDRPSSGGRRQDADSFAGAPAGTAPTSSTTSVLDARSDWSVGTTTLIRQSSAGRESASASFSSGAGVTSGTDSQAAAVGGRGYDGGIACNDRIFAFCVLRPASPIADSDAVLRRIQQSYCVSFGIPYRS
jgi:hypothetical protein